MYKRLLILLIVVLLPLTVFAQGDMDSSYLSEAAKEKLGIAEEQETSDEQTDVEEETEEPEALTIETPELPPAGSARDSPFYAIDRAMERLRLRLTTDEITKAELRLRFAEERLAEAKKLIELNKPELADVTIADYENELQEAEMDLEVAKEAGKDVEAVAQHVSETTAKHIEVLRQVLEQVPDTARPAIMKAIKVSQTSQDAAVKRLEQIKAEKELEEAEEAEEEEIETEETEEAEESEEELETEETPEEEPEEVTPSKGKGWH